jgi:hypothetical protein
MCSSLARVLRWGSSQTILVRIRVMSRCLPSKFKLRKRIWPSLDICVAFLRSKAHLWPLSQSPPPQRKQEQRERRAWSNARNRSSLRKQGHIDTLFVKSYEIWEIHGVHVAVIVRKNTTPPTGQETNRGGHQAWRIS